MTQHTNGGAATLTNETKTTLKTTREMLDKLIAQVRQDGTHTQEPKAQALFETTAEVLIGLRKAYEDYAEGGEKAWQ